MYVHLSAYLYSDLSMSVCHEFALALCGNLTFSDCKFFSRFKLRQKKQGELCRLTYIFQLLAFFPKFSCKTSPVQTPTVMPCPHANSCHILHSCDRRHHFLHSSRPPVMFPAPVNSSAKKNFSAYIRDSNKLDATHGRRTLMAEVNTTFTKAE